MHHYTEAARRKEDYSGVEQVGVDETSRAKGHDYVSLFVDLEERRTIFVAEGKGSETMASFAEDLKEHNGHPHEITDVSIDMSPLSARAQVGAFIKGVEENMPNAAITFDKYHILKIINTAVDDDVRNIRKKPTRQPYLPCHLQTNEARTQLNSLLF